MPIYEYECPACQHRISAIRPLDAAGVPVCTECNRFGRPDSEMVKVPSASNFSISGYNAKNGYSK